MSTREDLRKETKGRDETYLGSVHDPGSSNSVLPVPRYPILQLLHVPSRRSEVV